ncbi:spore gernimation protein [Clostridium carboxidivorans P7]|uniref:Spore germination protein n=1 Tax=Clostridium carboxidivorans P7 TaxID=536227 RepID=C6PXZ1_9CLOT|nr:GerAB/ArcD/ProY family transporter [Clostridium carboxidivorans]AKN31213.1 spore gernimation protein [Clostridium carboxidivorans P7]EET85874.1 Spore germination protein [Clostridium carboxidivorans P7]EFG88329.1 spore germination protein [Clostridium carboxidivorans P7]
MNARYFYILIINANISQFMIFVPYALTQNIEKGFPIAILIGLVVASVNAYFTIYVYNHFKSYTLTDISIRLFGKVLGHIFVFFHIVLYIIMSLFMSRGLLVIINNFMLPNTSVIALGAVFLLLIITVFKNSNDTYLNFISFITVIMALWAILQLELSFREMSWFYVKGSIIHSMKFPTMWLIGISAFIYCGLYPQTLFNPLLKRISWIKTVCVFIFIGLPIASLIILIPVGIWGPVAVKQLLLVHMLTADTMAVDLFVIERVLFLLLPLFILYMLSNILNYAFTAKGLFISLNYNKYVNMFFVVIISIVFFLWINFMSNTKILLNSGIKYISIYFWIQFILSFIFFIFTKIRGKFKDEIYS